MLPIDKYSLLYVVKKAGRCVSLFSEKFSALCSLLLPPAAAEAFAFRSICVVLAKVAAGETTLC